MIAEQERAKYAEMWSVDHYSQHSPGVAAIPRFLAVTGAQPPDRVQDYGCGMGAASLALMARGFQVTGFDLVTPPPSVPHVPQVLWRRIDAPRAPWGFCVDVMEHIPVEFTMLAVARMLDNCQRLYLEIALEPDRCGIWIGQTLHHTVRPFTWWRDRLREIATVVDARDLLQHGAYLVEA